MYLWRAVDHEGEILDVLLQRWRDRRAAVKLMRKLLRPWRQRVQLAENGLSGFTRE
jgi:transposase-like protein